jgi:8-oxo-dGTP diphosphatase
VSGESPTIRVAALLVVTDRILLVEQAKGDTRYWLLPGGGVQFGESLEECLQRELIEEIGAAITVGRPIGMVESIAPAESDYHKHVLHIVFAASFVDEQPYRANRDVPATDPAILRAAFHAAPEVNRLDLRPPIADFLQACLRGLPPAIAYLGRRW